MKNKATQQNDTPPAENKEPVVAWDGDYDIDAATAAREARIAIIESVQRRTYKASDFVFDTGTESFWNLDNLTRHTALSVNAMIPMEYWRIPILPKNVDKEAAPIPPSKDIMRIESDQQVEGATWWPGKDRIIHNYLTTPQGTMPCEGVRLINVYRPGPVADVALADLAQPWIDHVKRLYPEPVEHEFFFDYCAHMVQFPHIKANSAVVLSGKQGIGKDAMLHPVRMAVGGWNSANVNASMIMSSFNPWVQTLMLTVDEMQPTDHDQKASGVYNAMKTLITTPPNTIAMNEKHAPAMYIVNVMRVFVTTNDRMSLFIPKDDRRMFIMHSELDDKWHLKTGEVSYFKTLFDWIEDGGCEAVAGWLAARDVSAFEPKGDVPKTAAWDEIGQGWNTPDDELSQALEILEYPDCVISTEIRSQVFDGSDRLAGITKARSFLHRMSNEGYRLVPPPRDSSEWRVKVDGKSYRAKNIFIKESLKLNATQAYKVATARLMERAKKGWEIKLNPRANLHLEPVSDQK